MTTLVSGLVFGHESPADVVMLYLFASVLVAMASGFGPSVAAALLSVFAFDFCFVPPYFSFAVTDLRHLVTFSIMFLVSITINGLTTRVREAAALAGERERRTGALYAMSRDLARTTDAAGAAEVAARHVRAAFGGRVQVSTPDAAELHRSGDVAAGATPQRVTLVATRGTVGTLTLETPPESFADPDQRQLLAAFASQLAVALERSQIEVEREAARTETLREQLKNTLLSSVSHDLRTPLTTVIGASSALLEQRSLTDSARRELLEVVNEEALRLDRLVGNLLSMTRLEAGPLAIRREVQPLEEVVGVVLGRLEPRLAGRPLTVAFAPDLPLIEVDGLLVEQLFTNLLENALRYTGPGTPVAIRARPDGNHVRVEVADRGPGVPTEARARVFDKFHRLEPDRSSAGVGLGLAICRAIVEAHGGKIVLDDDPEGGARFTFTLPAAEVAP